MSSYSEFRAQTRRRRRKKNFRRAMVLIVTALVLCALAWVITWIIGRVSGDEDSSSGGSSAPASSQSQAASGSQTEETNSGEGTDAQPAGWNVVGPIPKTIDDTLVSPDYRMIALPENGRVDTSYFANTLFIGDSVSQGWWVYENPIQNVATFCAYKSAGPNSVVTNAQLTDINGNSVLLQDDIAAKLAEKQPEHIYILFGANSLKNLTPENFIAYYEKMLDWLVTVCRPDAQIYIQSLTPVTAEYEASDARYSQANLYSINNSLAQMAYNRGLYFIDLTETLAGDDGYTVAEYAAADGIHLQAAGYRAWLDYLSEHTAYSPTNPYLEGSPYYKEPQA